MVGQLANSVKRAYADMLRLLKQALQRALAIKSAIASKFTNSPTLFVSGKYIASIIVFSFLAILWTRQYSNPQTALIHSVLIFKIGSLIIVGFRVYKGAIQLIDTIHAKECEAAFGKSRMALAILTIPVAIGAIIAVFLELKENLFTGFLVERSYLPSEFSAEICLLFVALAPIFCMAYINLRSWREKNDIPENIRLYGKYNFLHAELPCLVATTALLVVVFLEKLFVVSPEFPIALHLQFDHSAKVFIHGALAFLIFSVGFSQDVIHELLK